MSDDIISLLNALEPAAQRINVATAFANSTIAEASARLKGLGLGIEFWPDDCLFHVPLEEDRAEQARELGSVYRLGLGHTADKGYDLAFRQDVIGFQEGEQRPVAGASRMVRIAAVKVLPRLLRSLHDKLRLTVADIDRPSTTE